MSCPTQHRPVIGIIGNTALLTDPNQWTVGDLFDNAGSAANVFVASRNGHFGSNLCTVVVQAFSFASLRL